MCTYVIFMYIHVSVYVYVYSSVLPIPFARCLLQTAEPIKRGHENCIGLRALWLAIPPCLAGKQAKM